MTQMTWSQASFESTKFGWLSFWRAARLNCQRGWHVLEAWRGPSVSPVMFWKQRRVWQMPRSLPQGLFGSLCYHVLNVMGPFLGVAPRRNRWDKSIFYCTLLSLCVRGENNHFQPARLLFTSTDRRQMIKTGQFKPLQLLQPTLTLRD